MTKTKFWLSILAISVVLIAGSLAVSPIAIASDDDDDDDDDDELSELVCEAGKVMTGILFEDDDEITDILCGAQLQGPQESQVYEVSGVSVVPAELMGGGSHIGNQVQLRCLDGDWFLGDDIDKPVALSVDDPSVVIENEVIISRGSITEEFERGIAEGFSKPIGWDGRAEQIRGFQLVDIPVTITGLCASPSP